MKKAYYLKTCNTCTKILKELNLEDWELREIKSTPLTEEELEEMYARTKSYEALFSKRSTQLKARNLNTSELSEEDYKTLILDHYSFLKRPVFITAVDIFIGSQKENIERLIAYQSKKKYQ